MAIECQPGTQSGRNVALWSRNEIPAAESKLKVQVTPETPFFSDSSQYRNTIGVKKLSQEVASGNCLSDIAKEVSSDLSAKRNRLHLLAMVSLGLVSTRGRTLSELKWSAHPADELMRGWLVPVQRARST